MKLINQLLEKESNYFCLVKTLDSDKMDILTNDKKLVMNHYRVKMNNKDICFLFDSSYNEIKYLKNILNEKFETYEYSFDKEEILNMIKVEEHGAI